MLEIVYVCDAYVNVCACMMYNVCICMYVCMYVYMYLMFFFAELRKKM